MINVPGLGPTSLNEFADMIHQDNIAKGFYDDYRQDGTLLALVHSEVSETLEANRKNRWAEVPVTDVLEIEADEEFVPAFEAAIKDMEQDEVADAMIRLLDYAAYKKMPIEEHILAKLRYNRTRPYRHGKAY